MKSKYRNKLGFFEIEIILLHWKRKLHVCTRDFDSYNELPLYFDLTNLQKQCLNVNNDNNNNNND